MLTAEGGDRKVTCDPSYFKKLDQDHADPVSVDTNSSTDPVSVDTNSSTSAQAEPPLRRFACVTSWETDSRNVTMDIVELLL